MNRLASVMALLITLLLASTVSFATDVNLPAKPTVSGVQKAASVIKEKTGLLDINTASEAELKKIPGVGDVYAKKIVAGRPYANKEQLKSKKIIPASLYDKIKDKIKAKKTK